MFVLVFIQRSPEKQRGVEVITKDVIGYIVGQYLERLFGENLKTVVKEKVEKDGKTYYFVMVRVEKSFAGKMFSKITTAGNHILRGLR